MFAQHIANLSGGSIGEPIVIINDIWDKCRALSQLLKCEPVFGKYLIVLKEETLAKELHHLICDLPLLEKSIIVLPGRSALHLWRSMAGIKSWEIPHPAFAVHAERIQEVGRQMRVSVSDITTEVFLDTNTRCVLVIDDVVSTGETMKKLHERNGWKFPRARWFGAALLSRREKISGYLEIVSSILVPPYKGKKQPINSLSTLLDDPVIASEYAAKYFRRPEDFELSLSYIRGELYQTGG